MERIPIMFIKFNSKTNYFCSAKATETRSGCWNSAVYEFCLNVLRALHFCIFASADFLLPKANDSALSDLNHPTAFSDRQRICVVNIETSVFLIEASKKIAETNLNTRCCNSAARVMRCQRRDRGFESPQHRHGIGRPVVRTLVCETKDAGANPVQSPNWV